jgi:glucosamine--fructose-6-phosphate aminotransferase (isomerizing)
VKSLGNFPDPFIAEIAGQPGALRRAADAAREQHAALRAIGGRSVRTLVFCGMGSSYDACYPSVTALAGGGIAAVMLDAAELLHFRLPIVRGGDLLVLVSQSGESAETVRVAEAIRTRGDAPTIVAVTNGTTSSLASLADVTLDTRAGAETGPSTMTFAASLATLAVLGRTLAGDEPKTAADAVVREADRVAASIGHQLADPLDLAERLATWHGDRPNTVLLGRGRGRAAAEMGALTLKEAVGMPVESLQTGQFRHGPLELAGPGLAAIVIATEPETLDLDLALASELAALGSAVLVVSERGDEPPGSFAVGIGQLDRALSAAAAIVPTQLLAWRLAALRGRDPGAYEHASKVTTRE